MPLHFHSNRPVLITGNGTVFIDQLPEDYWVARATTFIKRAEYEMNAGREKSAVEYQIKAANCYAHASGIRKQIRDFDGWGWMDYSLLEGVEELKAEYNIFFF